MKKSFNVLLLVLALALFIVPVSLPKKNLENSYKNSDVKILNNSHAVSVSYNVSGKKIMEPVVKLMYVTPIGIAGSATGFSVKYDKSKNISYVLTNNHFCEVDDDLDGVGFFSYSDSDAIISDNIGVLSLVINRLEIEKREPERDLCLLSVYGHIKPVKLERKGYKPKKMDEMYIVGGPKGIFPIVRKVYFTGFIDRDFFYPHLGSGNNILLLSDLIIPGQSGSPVYNSRGKVVGIIFMGFTDVYGGGAIPLSDIYAFLND